MIRAPAPADEEARRVADARDHGCRGSSTIEHVGLVALLAAALGAAAIVLTTEDGGANSGLSSTIAMKIRCAAKGPGPCRRDPLTVAYGRPLAGVVRALAPPVRPVMNPGGEAQLPVDFRRCRRSSCAVPLACVRGERLTIANRRTTAFTAVRDDRRAGGRVEVTYWLYRPHRPWEAVRHSIAGSRVSALAGTALLESSNPRLVPLETLAGRNHFGFRAVEEPPWRWLVAAVIPG
ncbi:MAG: hypothetical protein ACR2N5_01725 [Solirubrobacterales bacterium]